MTAPLLHLDGVSRVYKRGGLLGRQEFRAVDNVSFRLEGDEPQVFTIIGESGSGKTTLARMILNMVRPSAGTIFFKGGDLASIRGTGGAAKVHERGPADLPEPLRGVQST
jgi:ABC-type oligopeptide transport system ATPase subunit